MADLITIIGPSGIGKTTLARVLAERGNFATAFEQHEERPFQALLKMDPRYGFANQIDYLLLRAEQERALRKSPLTGLLDGGLDLDFHGFTRIFKSHNLLTDPEYDLCRRLYETIRSLLPLPELIVRLRADQATVTSRLSVRDRINIASPEDFVLVESYLDEWINTLPFQQVLEIDVSENDLNFTRIIPSLLSEISNRLHPISL